ncbi:hypothetical protein D3C72_1659760 [compost metagenome]
MTVASIPLQFFGDGTAGVVPRAEYEADESGGRDPYPVLLIHHAQVGQTAEYVVLQGTEGDIVHAAGIDGEGEGIGHGASLGGIAGFEDADGQGIF